MHVLLDQDSPMVQKMSSTTLSQSEDESITENVEELIRQISRLIKRETHLGVQEMKVCMENGKMIISGYCRTFYTKQLAQEAALKILGNVELVNNIRVA